MGIPSGPVPVHQGDLDRRAQFAQRVGTQAGDELAGHSHRTQFFPPEIDAQPGELLLDYPVIKIHGMGHKDTPFGQLQNGRCQILEHGGEADHLIVDARQTCDKLGNRALGVHQGGEFIDDFVAIMPEKGKLGDFVSLYAVAGGLYVNDGIHKLWFQIQVEFMQKANGVQVEYLSFLLKVAQGI